jgi:uncharacterized protein with GYD domain
MPTYITLLRWTSKGLENIKESPARLDAARNVLKDAGVTMKDFYMVTGRYDMVIISEASDDAALAKAMLTVASKGSVQTETLRAFSEKEYRNIMGSL